MNYRKHKHIKQLVLSILQEVGITKPPVNVKAIAKFKGIALKHHDMGDEISGLLVIKNGKATIGFNPEHHDVRTRFTIAHELGHYELQHERGGVFIDGKKHFSVFFRDQNSSTGEMLQEREANAFAAALLMPEHLLLEEIKKYSITLTEEDDAAIAKLAKKFQVSRQAMLFRITNLNLFV